MIEKLSSLKGLEARKAALEVIQAVGGGAFADIALAKIFKIYSFKLLDKALVTELSYGVIRQRYFLDCWIDLLGKVSAKKQPPILRWLLHLGLYQLFKMQRIPPAAAINTTVELAKTHHLAKLAPVVNGILRSALRSKNRGVQLPKSKNPSLELAINESLPVWLAGELISWRGLEDAYKIGKAFNSISPIDIRVNKIRAELKEVKESFDSCGIQNKWIPNCPYGLEIPAGVGEPRKWPGYAEGKWSVQDRSSQLIAPFLGACLERISLTLVLHQVENQHILLSWSIIRPKYGLWIDHTEEVKKYYLTQRGLGLNVCNIWLLTLMIC